MKKKDKEKLSVTTALLWRVGALVLTMWVVVMVLITLLVANNVYDKFRAGFYMEVEQLPREVYISEDLGDACYQFLSHYEELDETGPSGYYEYSMILRAGQDENGEYLYPRPVLVGDGDLLVIHYRDPSSGDGEEGWAFIDLQETAFGQELITKAMKAALITSGNEEEPEDFEGWISWSDYSNMKYEGWIGHFEGMEFHLTAVADHTDGVSSYQELDPERITTVAEPEPGQEIVMIYPDVYNMKFHQAANKPVTNEQGKKYDSLGDMLTTDGYVWKESLTEAVFTTSVDLVGEDGLWYEVAIAMRCEPLRYTLACIWPLYIWSLIPLVVFLLLFRRRIRRELTVPMREVAQQGEKDMAPLFEPPQLRWRESWQLQQGYIRLQQRFQELKKENTQLRTALDYAKNAEENRKQMISGISHELKTPLAVIHSYAEGLSEGIAKEKQGQYLNVILDETEQMDAMVLEMLDHSRLEAGKVRLQSDPFSLSKLTIQILETLRPMAEARGLQLQLQTMDDFQVTADEARISQVIRNLAANAITYTPEGGQIWVNVFHYQDRAHFTIENQCEPLSQEALEKIWETFYRADPSRSAKGTGLGLPIAKSIIDLHGGTCSAENTQQGVIFRFTLP